MSDHHPSSLVSKDEKPIRFLFENSAFLILGTLAALIWANSGELGQKTHNYFFNQFELKHMFSPPSEEASAKIFNNFQSHGAEEAHSEHDGDGHDHDGEAHHDKEGGEHSGHHDSEGHGAVSYTHLTLPTKA